MHQTLQWISLAVINTTNQYNKLKPLPYHWNLCESDGWKLNYKSLQSCSAAVCQTNKYEQIEKLWQRSGK